MKLVRARAVVAGRVQGVFFRGSAHRRARELGLTGYARNLPDGRVEVVVEGEEAAVESALEWLRDGPPLARVSRLEIEREPYSGEFDGFEVL